MSGDWKPGDRFTLEFEVTNAAPDGWVYASGWGFGGSIMARAVKLPPKARPVRKGDELLRYGSERHIFVAVMGGDREFPIITLERGIAPHAWASNAWTHPDGTPVDWEASE